MSEIEIRIILILFRELFPEVCPADILHKHGLFFGKNIFIKIVYKIRFGVANDIPGSVLFRVGTFMEPFAAELHTVFFEVISNRVRHRINHTIAVGAQNYIFHLNSFLKCERSEHHNYSLFTFHYSLLLRIELAHSGSAFVVRAAEEAEFLIERLLVLRRKEGDHCCLAVLDVLGVHEIH